MTTESQPESQPESQTPASRDGQALSLYRRYHATMLEKAIALSQDKARTERIMAGQSDKILSATSLEDIWAADMAGTVQARDAENLEVTIYDYVPVLSNNVEITDGHGYYFSMNATAIGGPQEVLTRNSLTLGQDFVLQSGAELFTIKVSAMAEAGHLPQSGLIFPVPNTKGMLKFYPLPKRVTPGTTE